MVKFGTQVDVYKRDTSVTVKKQTIINRLNRYE